VIAPETPHALLRASGGDGAVVSPLMLAGEEATPQIVPALASALWRIFTFPDNACHVRVSV